MITENKIVTFSYYLRSPVVVALKFGWHVVVGRCNIIDVHFAINDSDGVTFYGDHALYKGFLRIERIQHHDDVLRARISKPIHKFVDDDAIASFQSGSLRLAVEARELPNISNDEACEDAGIY